MLECMWRYLCRTFFTLFSTLAIDTCSTLQDFFPFDHNKLGNLEGGGRKKLQKGRKIDESTLKNHSPNVFPRNHPALRPHLSPTHTPYLLSLKVLLMISIKPNPPQHPLLPPRPPMLQGPRRDRQETLPKYKFHPLKGEGGNGHAVVSRGGAGPCGPEGRVGGFLGLTLLSALADFSPVK
jgi:hypothetical protein